MSVDLSDEKIQNLVRAWCGGNEDATRLVLNFAHLARLVDDIVDEDVNDKQSHVSAIVETSLVNIATNPFFLRNHQAMQAMVHEMLTYWRLADEFRDSDDERKQTFGFVYRESTDRLVVAVAGLIGGTEHALNVAKQVYHLTHAHSSETIEEWVNEGAPHVRLVT